MGESLRLGESLGLGVSYAAHSSLYPPSPWQTQLHKHNSQLISAFSGWICCGNATKPPRATVVGWPSFYPFWSSNVFHLDPSSHDRVLVVLLVLLTLTIWSLLRRSRRLLRLGMPEMLKPTSLIIGAGLSLDVACLTDGRFSGG